jgi:uncharacterized protein
MGRKAGSNMTLELTLPSPVRIGLDLVAIDKDAPLTLDLRLESVSEGVLVSGTVSGPTTGQCTRCLSPVTGEVQVYLTELFAYPEAAEELTEDDDIGRVEDDYVELEQVIIDAVGLKLPLSPLCTYDCPGLCVECGVALATAEPGHHHDLIDPRWAKLSTFISGEPVSERTEPGEPQDKS